MALAFGGESALTLSGWMMQNAKKRACVAFKEILPLIPDAARRPRICDRTPHPEDGAASVGRMSFGEVLPHGRSEGRAVFLGLRRCCSRRRQRGSNDWRRDRLTGSFTALIFGSAEANLIRLRSRVRLLKRFNIVELAVINVNGAVRSFFEDVVEG